MTDTTTILRNTFHETEYRTTRSRDDIELIDTAYQRGMEHLLSPEDRALAREIRKSLCGIDGCKCSVGSLGMN